MPFSPRMMLKVKQIARMRIAGIRDTAIAQALNITNSCIQRIIRLPDYREYEEAIFQGHISKMDEALAAKTDLLHRQARIAVPMALQTIIETAMQRRDLKSALAASKEILDRDPDRQFVSSRDSRSTSDVKESLPTVLFEALSKDADGVSASVAAKLKKLEKVDA